MKTKKKYAQEILDVINIYSDEDSRRLLIESIILGIQDENVLNVINNNFASPNPLKQDLKAVLFCAEDFKSATLLQVDGMFNPSKMSPVFSSKTDPYSL